jgi:hypothetical protein
VSSSVAAISAPAAAELEASDAQPWDRQPNENSRSFTGFCVYRDIAPAIRSAAAVAEKTGEPPDTVRRWRKRLKWVSRALAWDVYVDQLARADAITQHRREIEEFRTQQAAIAAVTLAIVRDGLAVAQKKIAVLDKEDLTPAVLNPFLRAMAAIAEASTNANAQAIGVTDLLAMIDADRQRARP